MSAAATSDCKFTCLYDASRRQLLACWHAHITDVELYEHYAELMALAEAHANCRFWLLDERARNASSSTFGRWFGNEFAPLAHAAFGRPLFIAYVVMAEHREVIASLGAQAMQHSCAAHDVYPFYFDSFAEAQAWLWHQQAHDEETRIRPTPGSARRTDGQSTTRPANSRRTDV